MKISNIFTFIAIFAAIGFNFNQITSAAKIISPEAAKTSERQKEVKKESKTQDPNQILFDAIQDEDAAKFEEAVKAGANLNFRYEDNSTPLIAIIERGAANLLKFIFDLAAKNNVKLEIDAQDQYGNTAIHNALLETMEELVEPLIIKGADVNIQNSDGDTPLILAAKFNYPDAAKELLYAKAKKYLINNENKSVYHYVYDAPDDVNGKRLKQLFLSEYY